MIISKITTWLLLGIVSLAGTLPMDGMFEHSIQAAAQSVIQVGISSISSPIQVDMIKNKETKPSEESVATVMFTGDLMCLGGQQNAARTSKGTYEFKDSFQYVKPLFSKADLLVGNLETLISPSNPYTYKQKNVNGNPNCNAMASYLSAIKDAGFRAVVTANNHCLDGKVTGIKETIDQLNKKKILHTGTYKTSKEQRFLLIDVNDIRVAILSYTELLNGRYTVSENVRDQMVSCYDIKQVKKDISTAKKRGADFIVVYNHWGTENTHSVTKTQEEHAKEIANAGADLILGSHPHCLQKADYITTKDHRKVLCMYSMGNFVSSMVRDINQDTIILKLDLKKTKDKVTVESSGYYGAKVFMQYEKDHFVLIPTKDTHKKSKTVLQALKAADKRIQSVIGKKLLPLS